MCVLRAYLRHRAGLIEHRAPHIQHMQKALLQMNVQLTQVLSDITGVTGMAIIGEIVAGNHDPVKLAELRDPRCAKPESEIAKALTGNYRAEHLFALRQALALYDVYTQKIAEPDNQDPQSYRSGISVGGPSCRQDTKRLWHLLSSNAEQERASQSYRCHCPQDSSDVLFHAQVP